jgi:predicted DNA-binding protein
MKPKRRGRGQPPKGPGGELVSQYPPLTVRIPPETKHQLEALSVLRQTPMWSLVDESVRAYIEQLPDAERRLLAQFAQRRSGRKGAE